MTALDKSGAILETTIVTEQQTESLMQLLELTPEEMKQVSGGAIHIHIACISVVEGVEV